jgi:hypothetical protein
MSAGTRAAWRELLQAMSMWFGLGEPDSEGTAPPARTAGYMVIQTLAAVMLGALLAGAREVWAHYFDRDFDALFLPGYVPLMLPLVIAVARRPADAVAPLAAALPAGVLVVVAVRVASVGAQGFWWWFLAAAAGVLIAGAVFGALSARRARTRPTA